MDKPVAESACLPGTPLAGLELRVELPSVVMPTKMDEELELDGIASTSAERRMRPELLSRFSLPVVCGLNLDGQCAWVSGRDRAMPQIAPL